MKLIEACLVIALLSYFVPPAVSAQKGAGVEWQSLNQEMLKLYRAGGLQSGRQ